MKKLRKFILGLLAIIILAGPVSEIIGSVNVTKVYAAKSKTKKPLKLTKKQKQISKEIKANGTIAKKGKTTTFTISDDALEEVFVKNRLIKRSEQNNSDMLFRISHAGKTTVKWYGNAWKGNFNVYLSKKTLNLIRKKSITGAFNIIISLLGVMAHVPGRLITFVAHRLASLVLGEVVDETNGHFKAGRKFKIRHWKYKGWSYQ